MSKPSHRSLLLAAVTALLVTAFSTGGTALAQPGPATRHLRSRHDQVSRLIRQNHGDDRVTTILSELLDYEAVSKAALAQRWDDMPPAQRLEFVALLKQLVERSYRQNLEGTLEYQINYGAEHHGGDGTIVDTVARSRRNRRAPEITIAYTMQQRGDDWVVVDVTTDGISMVRNYRSHFARIIRRDGFDGLFDRMRSRLQQGESL